MRVRSQAEVAVGRMSQLVQIVFISGFEEAVGDTHPHGRVMAFGQTRD
jgi:hypothetical protein